MINSKTNATIKLIKSLKSRKRRKETGLFLLEGNKNIEDALANQYCAIHIIQTQKNYDNHSISSDVLIVTDELFKYLSATKTPQGIIAVFSIPKISFDEIITCNKILYLDNVQNSDNVGALIRSAVCAGYGAVLLGNGSADPYSEKAVRASAGAVLNIKCVNVAFSDVDILKNNGYLIVGAHLQGADMKDFANEKFVLFIGNEGTGMSEDAVTICDILVKIPIYGNCESLNAAVAGSILMYKTVGY